MKNDERVWRIQNELVPCQTSDQRLFAPTFMKSEERVPKNGPFQNMKSAEPTRQKVI